MNDKGMTLVEIIISVGLISVVMLFLFHLLIDMQYEENYASFAKDNQLDRATIMKTIQEDFVNLKLTRVTPIRDGSGVITNIRFSFENGADRTLSIEEQSLSYPKESEDKEVWNLKGSNEETKYDIRNIKIDTTPDNTCSYILNVDVNGDGTCDYNCNILNAEGSLIMDPATKNETYRTCSSYQYYRIVIPVVTGDRENVIDDIEFFYIGRKN